MFVSGKCLKALRTHSSLWCTQDCCDVMCSCGSTVPNIPQSPHAWGQVAFWSHAQINLSGLTVPLVGSLMSPLTGWAESTATQCGSWKRTAEAFFCGAACAAPGCRQMLALIMSSRLLTSSLSLGLSPPSLPPQQQANIILCWEDFAWHVHPAGMSLAWICIVHVATWNQGGVLIAFQCMKHEFWAWNICQGIGNKNGLPTHLSEVSNNTNNDNKHS